MPELKLGTRIALNIKYLHISGQQSLSKMNNQSDTVQFRPMSWPELQQKAEGNWLAIFEDLAPEKLSAAVAAYPMHVQCPVHGGADGYRLFDHANKTGRGICNTCGPQKSGFATLAWAKGIPFEDACRSVAQWVRGELVRPARPARQAPVPVPRMDPALAYKKLCFVWRATTALPGTAAEKYLINRGIWADNLPRTLRAHPGLLYYDPKTKTSTGPFPCLVAPITDANGMLVSIHRIYLTPDGMKADVPDPKKMMSACSDIRGASIKLFEPEETLGLSEGIETGLAAYAVSRMPVWPCVTAVLMELVELPVKVKHVVIWADLDRSRRGIEAANILADRMEKLGKTVEVYTPQGAIPADAKGVDWLDVMLTKGLSGFPAKWRRWRPTDTPNASGLMPY